MDDQLPSKKQHELLSFIEGFIKGNGYGPSYREIMRALDYKSVSTVAVHVDGLIARGYLAKRDHSARSLEVVKSQNSGKTVEKQFNDHETWLKELIIKRINVSKALSSDQRREQAGAVFDSLSLLGLHDLRKDLESKLVK